MIIAVDFDGTIVTDQYPKIGTELPFATETLRMLIKDRHRLILWTVREGKHLEEALEWCHQRGVDFYAVNKDFPEEDLEKTENSSRKIKADIFIDDRGIAGLPDWGQIYEIISSKRKYKDIIAEQFQNIHERQNARPKRWWQKF